MAPKKQQAKPVGATRSPILWCGLGVVVALLALYSQLPFGSALLLGGDEGNQLSAALLASKGFKLYRQIWDDQPPLSISVLALVFKTFGPSILLARLIAAGFGLLLFGAFYRLVSWRSGHWVALLATFFLLASPAVLELSVSVMPEAPAFAVGLVSACLLFQWRRRTHWGWLLASGAVMGVAMGIKLTVLVLVPAMVTEVALQSHVAQPADWKNRALRLLLTWGASAAAIFATIMFVWGGGSLGMSYKSHFVEHAVPGLGGPQDYPPTLSAFLDHFEVMLAAAVGLVLVGQKQLWRELAFPGVMLFTAGGIHAVHRPWWMYYYLHLAIPLAWLASVAVVEGISRVRQLLGKTQFKLSSSETWKGIALCGLVGVALVRSEERLEADIRLIRQNPSIEGDPVVAKMKEYGSRTHWAFVQYGENIYPFHAQLLMPPELAMVTLKRYWSRQITEQDIVETCQRYQVEQLLLRPQQTADAWRDCLTNYNVAYRDTNHVLYVAKRIEPR